MSGYLRVEVTQEDIDEGEAGTVGACPIALALRRQTGEDWRVGLWRARPRWNEKSHDLPKRAKASGIAFDAGRPVKPFTFRLPL